MYSWLKRFGICLLRYIEDVKNNNQYRKDKEIIPNSNFKNIFIQTGFSNANINTMKIQDIPFNFQYFNLFFNGQYED